MARDGTARELDREEPLLDRRGYLKLAGTAAASIASFGAAASADGSSGDTLLVENFEDGDWTDSFTWSWQAEKNTRLTTRRSHGGSSSLKVTIPEGTPGQLYGRYRPQDDGEPVQDELYSSCWVWFPPNFDTGKYGGKFGAGVEGIKEGEGSRSGEGPTGPSNNWRWRSWPLYNNSDAADDTVEISAYTYYMDSSGSYGDILGSIRVPKGQWLHVVTYAKLNTVSGGTANEDGKLKLWVNGELATDEDVRWTEKVERGVNASFNQYFGGSAKSPKDQQLFFDDWRVGPTHPSGDSSDSTTQQPETDEGKVLELISSDDMSASEDGTYEFTVDGSVSKRTSAGDVSAESNDSVSENGDGTVTVSGATGGGYGDSYLVDGTVTSMELEDESEWTIRYDGEEVTVAELTGDSGTQQLPNTLVIDGTDHPDRASEYTFNVSGEVRKSGDLGSINDHDTVSNGEISGRVIGGKDGYRFSGEVTSFSLDGPATVRVDDGS